MRLRICVIALLCICVNAHAQHGSLVSSKFFGTSIPSDSVALGTQTTGNYVGTLTAGTGIATSGAATGEGIAHALTLNQDFDFVLTGNLTFTPAGTDDFTFNSDSDSNFIINGTVASGTVHPVITNSNASGGSIWAYSNSADANDLWNLGRLGTGVFALQYGATSSITLNVAYFDQSGNASIGGTTWGASAAKNFAIKNGTAPTTAIADQIAMWSADFAAGDARMNLRSESGTASTFGNNEILLGVVTALPTCDSTRPGGIKIYQKGAGGTEQTSMCICQELAGAYAWHAVPATGDCS